MALPLEGFRVIELGSWVFVPSAAAVLAEWGADVIKIENPEGGDPMRGMVLRGRDGAPRSDGMDRMNHNKRSIGVDVKHPRGRDVLLDLCRHADVFMTSWLPAARKRAGVDVEDVRSANPSIVYARGSGYGPKGPDADRGAIEVTAFWARSGAAHYYAQQPASAFAPFIAPSTGDLTSGQTLAGGIAAALVRRERTGEGSLVDVSLFSEGIYAMSAEISRRKLHGAPAEPLTHVNATNPFINQYLTADGRVIQLGVSQLTFWPELLRVMGRHDLATDPRFAEPAALADNRIEAIAILDGEFASRPCADWVKILAKLDRGWEVVQRAVEVHDDPQVAANGFIAQLDRPGGTTPIVRNPVQFDEYLPEIHRSPDAGEHTDEILVDMGLDWDAIVDLKIAGAVL